MTKIDTRENLALALEGFMIDESLLPSKECFATSWRMDPKFTDTVLNKVAVNKGGDSTKAIQANVNVENPQSQSMSYQ